MIDQIIEKYIQLRNKKAQLEAAHKKEVEGINAALKKCEGFILGHFNDTGVSSVGSASGTAYKAKQTSCTIADKDEWTKFLLSSQQWHLADIRPSKTAVAEMLDATQDIPPGLNWREESVIRVRAS